MPTNIRIIHARDFVRATPGGVLDLEASEKLLTEIAGACVALDELEVLLDTRKAMAVLSTSDLWHLAEKLTNDRLPFVHKTAVLCPAERFDHARFFAMCAERRGVQIQAFLDYEQAMEWLIGDDQAASTDR